MSISFALIVISAVCHAGWNLFVKSAKEKISYNIHIQIAAACMISFYTVAVYPEDLYFHKATFIYALLSSFFFALYQYLTSLSYKYADVSMVYPITTSSPFFIVIWAYFILHERVNATGFIGIFLILFGCYIMNMTRGRGNKSGLKGIILAFSAAFLYSFGAMADKMGVSNVNTGLYIMLMADFMALYSILFSVLTSRKYGFFNSIKQLSDWKFILGGAAFLAASTVTYRMGLVDMQISYASALRQLSSLFGVLTGILFLKESYGRQRIIGCIIIIAGITLIRLTI